jgi:hypothetical protein
MKIYRFNIGKNKKYFGWAVKFNFYFFTLKFERVGFKQGELNEFFKFNF